MDKEVVVHIHNGIFSSVQSLSRVRLFATPWIAAHQASLSITNSQSSPRLASIESVMPSSHLILGRPLFLLPPIPPSIKVFSNKSALRMRYQNIDVQLFQQHSFKRLYLLHCIAFSLLSKISGLYYVGLFLGFLLCAFVVFFLDYHSFASSLQVRYCESLTLFLSFNVKLALWVFWLFN